MTNHNKMTAEPYAYEYGRSNGDGTFSVFIERTMRDVCSDWPVKPLFDHAAPCARCEDAEQAEAEMACKLGKALAENKQQAERIVELEHLLSGKAYLNTNAHLRALIHDVAIPALQGMSQEFRDHDLPYRSKAYRDANKAIFDLKKALK